MTAIWNPPAPTTGRAGRSWQRSLSIGAVVAIHIVGIVMFAAKPLGFRLPGMDPENENVVYLDAELAAQEAAASAASAPADFFDSLESEASRRVRGDFVPPRLMRSSVPDIAEYVRRAGVEPGNPARVVLAVKVSELGVPGDIRVASSSGNTRADAMAVEFAGTLRWNPAEQQGRRSVADIRLPVELTAAR